MKKEEGLKKVQEKKVSVGEMEKSKINKSNWIANIVAVIVAVTFMIVEGAKGHFTALYAIGTICFVWAAVFYFCQYFVAKRPWQVLIGGVLHGIGAVVD